MGRVYPLGPVQQAEYPDKEFATLQARAALLGAMLQRFEDDRGNDMFVVSKWSLTRHLDSIEKVSAWLDRLGGDA